jgi:hypothetical protein
MDMDASYFGAKLDEFATRAAAFVQRFEALSVSSTTTRAQVDRLFDDVDGIDKLSMETSQAQRAMDSLKVANAHLHAKLIEVFEALAYADRIRAGLRARLR